MNLLRRQITLLLAGLTLGLAVSVQLAIAKKDKRESATSQMDGQKRALHALNRLAFGPRPGDVERVAAMGVDKWIDQQLHPDEIEDHALDGRLEQLEATARRRAQGVGKGNRRIRVGNRTVPGPGPIPDIPSWSKPA